MHKANVSMDFVGTNNGILTFEFYEELNDDDYTITFYATDSAGNVYSRTINFEVDTSSGKKKTNPKQYDDRKHMR